MKAQMDRLSPVALLQNVIEVINQLPPPKPDSPSANRIQLRQYRET